MPIDQLHDRIRRVRHAAGLSQQAVAEELGVRRSAVSQWEQSDGTRPSVGNLTALGVLTSTSLHWLLEGHGPMHHAFDPAREPAAVSANAIDEQALLDVYRRLCERRRAMAVRLLQRMESLA
jgi:transcriptional regulator with XRE-family HTH domain